MLRAFSATDGIAPPQLASGRSGSDCLPEQTLWQSLRRAFSEEAPWWGCSFAFHFVLLAAVALLAGMIPAIPRERQVEFSTAPPPLPDKAAPDIDPTPPVVPPVEFTPPDRDAIIEIAPPPGIKDAQAKDGLVADIKRDVDAIATTAPPDSSDARSSLWQPGRVPGKIGPGIGTKPSRLTNPYADGHKVAAWHAHAALRERPSLWP